MASDPLVAIDFTASTLYQPFCWVVVDALCAAWRLIQHGPAELIEAGSDDLNRADFGERLD